MTLSRPAAAMLAVLALVAAGCGGTSKEEYEEQIDEIGTELDRQFTGIGREIQGSGSLRKAAPEVDNGAEALDEAADDLEDVEPPDDAQAAHNKIVAGIRTLANDFRKAARAAASNDTKALLELFGNIGASKGARTIAEARKDLEDAGYDVAE